jgi:hypothetical protein
MGDFADLVCPFLASHSAEVAKLEARRRMAAASTSMGELPIGSGAGRS